MTTDKSFTPNEMAVLRSLVGQTIVAFEASPLMRNTYYEKVKVDAGEASVVLSNSFDLVDVGYEQGRGKEEVGTMRVETCKGPLVLDDVVSGPENAVVPIGSKVTSVEVVNDTIEMLRGGEATNSFKFTQAVIFHMEKGDLVIERNIWFEVFVDAYLTDDSRLSLRDTEADWNVGNGEDGYEGVVTREFIELE